MPKLGRIMSAGVSPLVSTWSHRETFLTALQNWNRNQAFRIVAAVAAVWMIGAVGIHLAEPKNPAFNTWSESFWSVWVILFSGLDTPPTTALGRFFAMVLLGAWIGLASLFIGTVASVLVERQLRRRYVTSFE